MNKMVKTEYDIRHYPPNSTSEGSPHPFSKFTEVKFSGNANLGQTDWIEYGPTRLAQAVYSTATSGRRLVKLKIQNGLIPADVERKVFIDKLFDALRSFYPNCALDVEFFVPKINDEK